MRGVARRAPLPDGGAVEYVDTGARAAAASPTLLLLHGWPDTLDTWRVLSCHLDPRIRLLALNLHGRGAEQSGGLERMATAETDPQGDADAGDAAAARAGGAAAPVESGWDWWSQLLRGSGTKVRDAGSHTPQGPFACVRAKPHRSACLRSLALCALSDCVRVRARVRCRPLQAGAVSTLPADGALSRFASLSKPPRIAGASSADLSTLSVEQLAADVRCVLSHAQV
jgi:pimeloyl-ACP methyl ester carboxylesterase